MNFCFAPRIFATICACLAFGGCTSSASKVATHPGQRVVSYSLHSRATSGRRDEAAVITGSSRGRGLLVLLPGRGGGSHSFTNSTITGPLNRLGADAPVVVGVDGGSSSFFHDRATGAWGSYVINEVIPDAIKRFHLDPKRVAIGGISMGGFGALDIARLHPGAFCAVGVREPAIWQYGGQSAAGAFDDATDFSHHDLVKSAQMNPDMYGSTPVWIDHGDHDAFVPGDDLFVAALQRGHTPLTLHVWPGTHFDHYTSRHEDPYIRFMAHQLLRCRR